MTGPKPLPLCREPWESFYILRRGILPCCYGYPIEESMDGFEAAWNSPRLQEIRSYLGRGMLSPFCLNCPGCPIVQRVRAAAAAGGPGEALAAVPPAPKALRILNRVFLRVPGRVWRALQNRKILKR